MLAFSFVWSWLASFLIMFGGLLALAIFRDNRFLNPVIFVTHLLGFILVSSAAVYCIEQTSGSHGSPRAAPFAGLFGLTGLLCLHFLRTQPWRGARSRWNAVASLSGIVIYTFFAWVFPEKHGHALNRGIFEITQVVFNVRIVGEALGLFALALLIHSQFLAARKLALDGAPRVPESQAHTDIEKETRPDEERKSA